MGTKIIGAAIAVLVLGGCTMLAGIEEDYEVAGVEGGAGAGGVCVNPKTDCPEPPRECVEFMCENGECALRNSSEGLPTKNQLLGNCRLTLCDGQGQIREESDDADATDGNDCTADSCSDGVAMHEPRPDGHTCMHNGGKECDVSGFCVECFDNPNCVSPGTCKGDRCIPDTCTNMMLDGAETDVDCGGAECLPCSPGSTCGTNADCWSNMCVGNVCSDCTDMLKNGTETGVDCGGTCPNDCPDGQMCNSDADCMSNRCANNVCISCTDGSKNGNETDTDCGGSDGCPQCAEAQHCITHSDCISQYCTPANTCA